MEPPKLERREDGYYRVRWTDGAGKRREKSFGADRRAARNRYLAWVNQWRSDPMVRDPGDTGPLTVALAVERYEAHAATYYAGSRETLNIRHTLRALVEVAGDTLASEIGPETIDAYRELQVARDISLGVINQRVRTIRRAWKWLASKRLVSIESWQCLCALEPLRRGRCAARVTEPVRPVADSVVERTCDALPPSIAAMVRLQRITGMRPGEVCAMEWREIDRSGEVWVYEPRHHKTAHHGHRRASWRGRGGEDGIGHFGRAVPAPRPAAWVISLANCSWAPVPKLIQLFISSSGDSIDMLAVIRACISSTIRAFSAVTSGRPMKARASTGEQSISTVIFMAEPPMTPLG
jgi:hypothetical protein